MVVVVGAFDIAREGASRESPDRGLEVEQRRRVLMRLLKT